MASLSVCCGGGVHGNQASRGGSSTSEASLGPFPGSMAKTQGTEPGLASAPAFSADQVAAGGGDTQAQSLASAGGGLAPGSPPVPCHLPGRPSGTFREDAEGLPAPALALLPRRPHPGTEASGPALPGGARLPGRLCPCPCLCVKNNNTLRGTVLCSFFFFLSLPKEHVNRCSSVGRSASGRVPW